MNRMGMARRLGVSLLAGIMYALFFAFGRAMEMHGTCAMPDTLFAALRLAPVFCCGCFALFEAVDRLERRARRGQGRPFSWLWAFAILLVCYLAWFVIVCPGTFAYDMQSQLGQIDAKQYTTHHPLLHTLLLGACIRLITVLGTLNRCAMLYALIQITLLALLFARTCASIAKSCSPRAAWLSVLFFALYPTHMCMASNATKDVLFSGSFALFLALSVQALSQKELRAADACSLAAAGALAVLLRNNMLYALAVWIVFLLVLLRGRARLRLAGAAILALALGVGVGGGLSAALEAEAGNKREMLSVPIQQLSRARLNAPERFTQEEIAAFNEIIAETDYVRYRSDLADWVKDRFKTNVFMADPAKYVSMYLSVGKKCAQEYLDAAVALTYPLLYPYQTYKVSRDYIETGISPDGFDAVYGAGRVVAFPQFEGVRAWWREHIWKTGADHIPVLRWLFNLGLISWVMLFLVLREAYCGRWQRFAVCLLPVLLWGTCLLGPVVQGRYIYPFVCSLPVLFARPGRSDCKEELP